MSYQPDTTSFKYNAFLSCAGEDKLHVKEFYNKLKQYGANIFYYDVLEDGAYGRNPDSFLNDALKNSQHLIFYWTRNSVKEWTNKEVSYFNDYCKNGTNREIIVYHDIIGKTDYTQLPENLRQDYYREVDFAELLDRIGANSTAYMEKRYFRLTEFLKKPLKRLNVKMKVGVGCCIWAAPVIREIMDHGGIECADITFFEKDQFGKKKNQSEKKDPSNERRDQTTDDKNGLDDKYEIAKSPYFYSRTVDSYKLFTIPPYLKGCVISVDELNSVLKGRIKKWSPQFVNLNTINKSYKILPRLIAGEFDELTIYIITPKTYYFFFQNTIAGNVIGIEGIEMDKLNPSYFENVWDIFYFEDVSKLPEIFDTQNNGSSVETSNLELNAYMEKVIDKVIQKLPEDVQNQFINDREKYFAKEKHRDAKKYLGYKADSLHGIFDKWKEIFEKKNKQENEKINIQSDDLDKKLEEEFPILSYMIRALDENHRHDLSQKLSVMNRWLKTLTSLSKILSKTTVKYGNFHENNFSESVSYKALEEFINQSKKESKKVNIRVYPANPSKEYDKLVVIEKESKVQGSNDLDKDERSQLGHMTLDTMFKIKNQFDESVEFEFDDEINNTKLYTARDIVGAIHDNTLDCIIAPAEVYDQEHEKGKNRDVLTKIASIMYTVEGGCDFMFISNYENEVTNFRKFARNEKSKEVNSDSEEEAKEAGNANHKEKRKEARNDSNNEEPDSLLESIMAILKIHNRSTIKLVYTPNTVSRKYHEKYFNSPKIVHEPCDIGDWNSLKSRIGSVLETEERLLVLAWQPQTSWIREYFDNGKSSHVCNENLVMLGGANDLPYLSYDIMLRTNALDTWFRSFAFESFLNTIKDSIRELNEHMQNPLGIDKSDEVKKVATFLNMKMGVCEEYLKIINFEFRYDADYINLYEQYNHWMNNDC